jgi:hypothetical protein
MFHLRRRLDQGVFRVHPVARNRAIKNAVNAGPDARHHSFAVLSCRPFMDRRCSSGRRPRRRKLRSEAYEERLRDLEKRKVARREMAAEWLLYARKRTRRQGAVTAISHHEQTLPALPLCRA